MKNPLVRSKVILHRAEDSCDEEDRADDMDREEEAQEHATVPLYRTCSGTDRPGTFM